MQSHDMLDNAPLSKRIQKKRSTNLLTSRLLALKLGDDMPDVRTKRIFSTCSNVNIDYLKSCCQSDSNKSERLMEKGVPSLKPGTHSSLTNK